MEDNQSTKKTTVGQKLGHQLLNSLNELEAAISDFNSVQSVDAAGDLAARSARDQANARFIARENPFAEAKEMLARLRAQLAELAD